MTKYVCYDKMRQTVVAYPRATDEEPIYNPDSECCACLTVVEQAPPAEREGYYLSHSWEVDLDAEEYRETWTELEEVVDLGMGSGV